MDVTIATGYTTALDALADAMLHRVAEAIAADARKGCPNEHVRATVRAEGTTVRVGSAWSIFEYGTDPHVIRPKVKAALMWAGAPHPVRIVHHPGTTEYAFMRRALYRRRESW